MSLVNEQPGNGVHVGTDGWLFLATGSNEALRLLTDEEWFVTEDARNWSLKLSGRLERLSALKAKYVHMWIPDKIKVYHEHLGFDPEALRVDPPRMVQDCTRQMGIEGVIIDPLPALLSHKEERLLYWKTDTHWTYWGACCAYQVLCSAIGAKSLDNVWDRPIHYLELTLDLGSKLSPPIQERWGAAQILRNSDVVYKNELLRFIEILSPNLASPMLRGASIGFRNSAPTCDERRVLIFGDSFSEFRPHLLTGLLAETFREVLFVWSTALDYSLVRSFRPDLVISEMAERFIKNAPEKNLPEDGFDLDSFAFDRITHFLNHRCGGGGNLFTWSKRPL
jgi:alginate O-acetyltransferase complex protein AlgJ